MSRARFLVGASHKTYLSQTRATAWAADVAALCRSHPAVTAGVAEVFVLPTHLAVPAVLSAAEGSPLLVGAQDVSASEAGPHTGEVTAAELAEVGCTLVAIGHAERRRDHGETDQLVAAKVATALRHGVLPLVCVGEPEPGPPEEAASFCRAQVVAALQLAREEGLSGELVVAYEPVWAIGAERPAGPDHIRAVCRELRGLMRGGNGPGVSEPAATGRVVYGGSAGPGLLSQVAPDVDGLFLGRRAHDPQAVGAVLDEVWQVASAERSPT